MNIREKELNAMPNIRLDLSYSGISEKEISKHGSKTQEIYNNLKIQKFQWKI